MLIFWVTYTAWFVSELAILRRDRRPVDGIVGDAGSRRLIVIVMLVSIFAAFLLAGRYRQFAIPLTSARVVGTGFMWAGIALRIWAVRTLGQYFRTRVTVLAEHRLVRAGPYRLIRHPAYTGALLTCLGLGIALASWLSLIVMLVGPLGAFAWRLRLEEKVLAERFGAEWAAHRQATWALLPPIW